MPSPAFHAERRQRLADAVQRPILLVGNGRQARNFPANTLPFRQDSTFLYFTGCAAPGAALLIDGEDHTLFLPDAGPGDALWHGPTPSLREQGAALGVAVKDARELDTRVAQLDARPWALSVSDPRRTALARRLSGLALEYGPLNGPDALIAAVIDLRLALHPEEIEAMRAAAAVTTAAHRAAMAATRPGRTEAQIAALFDGVCASHGMATAYHSIVTVRGEVLHNESYGNTLEDGQLLLLDGGAEHASGYATDVTRTWPVSGRFSGQQRAAYDAVLAAQEASIALCRAGTRYRDVHLASCRVLTRFLVDEGILDGAVDGLVERGAHALFFPHGVGHLIGLDVHDMEIFGDRAGYAPGRARSDQFGLSYLRLDRDLAPGMVVTIEPGFYVVPAILDDAALGARFADVLRRDRLEAWRGFGGIRIEDDVRITDGAPEVLTEGIPKAPEDLEALVGSAELVLG